MVSRPEGLGINDNWYWHLPQIDTSKYSKLLNNYISNCTEDFKILLNHIPLFPHIDKRDLKDSTIIYGLYDFGSDGGPFLRYIGKTSNPASRYEAHIQQSEKIGHKNYWIRKILNKNYLPIMIALERVGVDCENDREIALIANYKELCNLTNATMGGDGVRGHELSYEQRQRISQGSRGTRSKDPEGNRYRPISKIKRHSPESRKKIHEANVGEANHQARLTWEKVRELRARLDAGEIAVDIASEYGIGTTQISRIRRNICWKEI